MVVIVVVRAFPSWLDPVDDGGCWVVAGGWLVREVLVVVIVLVAGWC